MKCPDCGQDHAKEYDKMEDGELFLHLCTLQSLKSLSKGSDYIASMANRSYKAPPEIYEAFRKHINGLPVGEAALLISVMFEFVIECFIKKVRQMSKIYGEDNGTIQ